MSPMRRPGILHGGMATRIRRTMRQRVTIEQAEVTLDDAGGEVKTWSTLPGCFELPCTVSVLATTGIQRSGKRRTPELVSEHLERGILIGAHLPEVTPVHRAVVDSTTYEILAVDLDSQLATTRLQARVVS